MGSCAEAAPESLELPDGPGCMAVGHTITIIPADRHVEVSVGGQKLAESDRTMRLDDTGLPARYYIPREDVRTELLRPTARKRPARSKARRRTGRRRTVQRSCLELRDADPCSPADRRLDVLLQRAGGVDHQRSIPPGPKGVVGDQDGSEGGCPASRLWPAAACAARATPTPAR
jgi:Domain of unknown function (DUF427)